MAHSIFVSQHPGPRPPFTDVNLLYMQPWICSPGGSFMHCNDPQALQNPIFDPNLDSFTLNYNYPPLSPMMDPKHRSFDLPLRSTVEQTHPQFCESANTSRTWNELYTDNMQSLSWFAPSDHATDGSFTVAENEVSVPTNSQVQNVDGYQVSVLHQAQSDYFNAADTPLSLTNSLDQSPVTPYLQPPTPVSPLDDEEWLQQNLGLQNNGRHESSYPAPDLWRCQRTKAVPDAVSQDALSELSRQDNLNNYPAIASSSKQFNSQLYLPQQGSRLIESVPDYDLRTAHSSSVATFDDRLCGSYRSAFQSTGPAPGLYNATGETEVFNATNFPNMMRVTSQNKQVESMVINSNRMTESDGVHDLPSSMMKNSSESSGGRPLLPASCTQQHSESSVELTDYNDKDLVESRQNGLSYKAILDMFPWKQAESTLRGRYRSLTKPKHARVRKPTWSTKDIDILKATVSHFLAKNSALCEYQHLSHDSELTEAARKAPLAKVPWKQVAERMAQLGCYHFGNATVKKKYFEVMGFSKVRPVATQKAKRGIKKTHKG